jgi:hypothetical protein
MSEGTIELLLLVKRSIRSTDLRFSCKCKISTTRKGNFLNFFWIASRTYMALSWVPADEKPTALKVLLMCLRIFIKRPGFLTYTFLHLNFEPNPRCLMHQFLSEFSQWNSPSAIKVGFKWERDPFNNSLAFLRESYKDVYSWTQNHYNWEPTSPTLHYQKLQLGKLSDEEIIGTWKTTTFLEIENAFVHHGNALETDKGIVPNDRTIQSYCLPEMMLPSALWCESILSPTFYTPKSHLEYHLPGTYVFIDTNANLYHFVAEALRPLIFVLENSIEFDGVILRDELPRNFYEILEFLIPHKVVRQVGREETVRVERIISCQFDTPASQTSSFFPRQGDLEFQNADDGRAFKFIRMRVLASDGWTIQRKISSNEQHPEGIFVSIRPLQSSRGFLFHNRVSRRFAKSGISTIDLSRVPFRDVFESLMSAKYFVCESGAGMTNMLFASPFTTIVEVTYGSKQSWRTLAIMLDLNYFEIRISRVFQFFFRDYLDCYPFPISRVLRSFKNVIPKSAYL